MTAARMAREALEGKGDWLDAVRDAVSSALSSSAECRELARRLALGAEDFKGAEEGLRAAVLSGAGAALSALLSERTVGGIRRSAGSAAGRCGAGRGARSAC